MQMAYRRTDKEIRAEVFNPNQITVPRSATVSLQL